MRLPITIFSSCLQPSEGAINCDDCWGWMMKPHLFQELIVASFCLRLFLPWLSFGFCAPCLMCRPYHSCRLHSRRQIDGLSCSRRSRGVRAHPLFTSEGLRARRREKKECDGPTTSWEWWHQPADLLLQQTFDPLTHTGILFGKAVPAKAAVDGGNRWPTRSSERCIVKRWSSHPIIYTTRRKRQR